MRTFDLFTSAHENWRDKNKTNVIKIKTMRRRMWKTDLHEDDDVHDRYVIAGVATFNIQATSSCVLSTSLDIHTPPINDLRYSTTLGVRISNLLECLVALRKIGLLQTKSNIIGQFNRCSLMSLLCHVL